MSTKSRIAFSVPRSLKNEVRERIVKERYGFRGKSKWVAEALSSLLTIKNYPELVSYNDEMHGFDEVETITVEYKLKLELDQAVLQVRKKYPTLEGVKSRILRTAIMQRILRT